MDAVALPRPPHHNNVRYTLHMGFRCLRSISIFLVVGFTTSFLHAGVNADYTKAALRKLTTATQQQQNGEHLANLSALRNLRDPALKPFFYKLAQHNNWSIQVHAVLGLSELAENGLVDPWLVQQVAPLAREQLIIQSLRDDLLSVEDMQSLLDWSLLEPSSTLLLTADLHSKGIAPSADRLVQLVNNSDLGIATVAALLSEDSKTIRTVSDRLRRATTREKRIALSQTLQLIQLYALPSSSKWLSMLLASPAYRLTDSQTLQTLFTLLKLDKEVGMKHWMNSVPSEPTKLEQVRFILLLMDAEIQLDEAIAEKLKIGSEDGLPYTLYLAGLESPHDPTDGEPYVELLLALANRGHSKSTEWTFRRVENLPKELAQTFYTSLSMLPTESSANNARSRGIAVMAFRKLIKVNPDHAWNALREVEDDSHQQELMLLAMLQHRGDELLEREAIAIRRIGVARPDAMALLLAARGIEPLSQSDQRLLGLIAAGGASIGSPLETQAAWLYLRRMGMTDQALAAATTPSP